MWLKEIGKGMAKVSTGEKFDIAKVANNNPLPGKPKMKNPMDMAEIHFMLSMKIYDRCIRWSGFRAYEQN